MAASKSRRTMSGETKEMLDLLRQLQESVRGVSDDVGALRASLGTVKDEIRDLQGRIEILSDRVESIEDLDVPPMLSVPATRTRTTSSAVSSITGPAVNSHSPALLSER